MHQDRPVASFCPNVRRFPGAVRTLALSMAVVLSGTLGGCAGLPWDKAPTNLRGGYVAGDKVTAILPGKGPVADVADALREGLRAAHGADDTAAKPTLTFIASEQPNKIAEAHGEAVSAGATQVIGPLLKPAVDALATGPALKIPTLALNQSTAAGKAAGNLYQFALAPETEAVEAANQAKAMGFTRALMLAPAGEAGQRRADAFRRQWEKLGATLVGQASFDPAAADAAKTLTALLKNGEADFLFLAVDTDQARKIYPPIRDGANALPVIATSAVYSGAADAARDKALAGLYFVDLPWVLGVGQANDPVARANLKGKSAALATPLGLRLYAMGIDAYRLAPRLAGLAKDPAATFPGATGTLSLDSLGRVQRQLTLAQFTATGPQPVSAKPAAKQRSWMPFARPAAVAQPAAVATPAQTPSPSTAGPKPEPKRPLPQPAVKGG
ncbi:penicillin-binding protein activator [uncultured Lamprocystis sp.]|uniref:penicillin-binding protein activator n=1 Tax=uncultured Lamprocystis sp. TaxID=543132 RepID=UPI0025E47B67|nr:penicillin-binding protein activator [uncultured Lamprocystis sp.]